MEMVINLIRYHLQVALKQVCDALLKKHPELGAKTDDEVRSGGSSKTTKK